MSFSGATRPSPAASVSDSHAGKRSALPTWVLFVIVSLVSVLPYLRVTEFGFVYDDDVQILQNPLLNSWHSLRAIFSHQSWSFLYPAAPGGYYRPAFLIWLSINHHVFDARPAGWHLSSLLLHAIVSGLTFLLLRRHGFSPWTACGGALLFGLHPVHVESVAWISGSTDLLVAAGLLVSLLLWWTSQDRRSNPPWIFLLSLFFYLIALLTKETAIVFPAIIFVYAYFQAQDSAVKPTHRGDRFLSAFRNALPYAVVAGIYLALRRAVLGGFATNISFADLKTFLATAPELLLFYIRHVAWPSHHSLFYDVYPRMEFASSSFLVPLLVLIALAGLAAWLAMGSSTFSVVSALAWLLFPLLPVLWVPFFSRGDLAHDRYLYLPSLGTAILFAALLRRVGVYRQWRYRLTVAATAALLLLMAFSTAVHSSPWRDNLSLYSHSCSAYPDHPIACNNLAVALISRGEFFRAREVLRPLLHGDGNASRAYGMFGIASYRLADYADAEAALRRATQLDASYADAYLYLALTYNRTNRAQEAESLLRHAINLDPTGDGYHLALGSVLMVEHKYREACQEFRAELQVRPGLPAAISLLHDCEQQLGPAS
jgi:hypothetical protein